MSRFHAQALRQPRLHQLGLTMIELLIVVAILGFVVALGFFNVKKYIFKARDSQKKNDLQLLKGALEHYYDDHKTYPTEDEMDAACYSTSSLLSDYVKRFPCESANTPYVYESLADPQGFRIYTNLNDETDPSIGEVGCTGGCFNADYNYGVSSENTTVGDDYSYPDIGGGGGVIPPGYSVSNCNIGYIDEGCIRQCYLNKGWHFMCEDRVSDAPLLPVGDWCEPSFFDADLC